MNIIQKSLDMSTSLLHLSSEVLSPIVSYLDRASMYAVALTCRNLLSPALDYLWWEVDFNCIMAALPENLFDTSAGTDNKTYVSTQ